MTFRQLAVNNVKGSWHRYTAYFLSCAFSVLIFYLFASFIAHPVVISGEIVGGGRSGVTSGLYAAEVIILLFSFLFILYSTTAFLRSRKREFGLLTLLGMTQREIRRMLLIENTAIAGLALLAGLVTGVLFSKLFLMAMTVLMQLANPIYFAVPLPAILATVAVFTAMFLVLTWLSLLGVRQSSVRELLKAHRQERSLPRWRPLWLLLGVCLLCAGYALAWNTTGTTFIINMFPIIGLVVAGTYLIVLHGGMAVCQYLRRHRPTVWRGTNVVTVNRVVFRLRDNARIIFVIAILIAVVCSALGAFNTLLQNARRMAMDQYAYAVSFELPGREPAEDTTRDQVERLLRELTNRPVAGQEIPTLAVWINHPDLQHRLSAIAESDYRQATEIVADLPAISLAPNSALLVQPFPVVDSFDQQAAARVKAGELMVTLDSTQLITHCLLFTHTTLVVPDAIFQRLSQAAGEADHGRFFGFEYAGWERALTVRPAVAELVGEEAELLEARVEIYSNNRQAGALTMFIGVFVSCLFFIASASLLYFKLFTEAEDDRQQFTILRDLGLTKRELLRIVNQELGTVFFLPVLFGLLHAGFALKTLSNLITMDIWMAGMMVGSTYLLLQIGCFLLVRSAYLRQMLRVVI